MADVPRPDSLVNDYPRLHDSRSGQPQALAVFVVARHGPVPVFFGHIGIVAGTINVA